MICKCLEHSISGPLLAFFNIEKRGALYYSSSCNKHSIYARGRGSDRYSSGSTGRDYLRALLLKGKDIAVYGTLRGSLDGLPGRVFML